MRRIDELHLEHPFAGSRMLRDMRPAEDREAGRRHVSMRVPADGGRRFQRNVGARSRRSWARIPDDAGHGFQLIVGARMMGALRPTV
jgi:putative transposase